MATTVTVIGNLTADPEMRFTQTGKALATLNVAENPRYRDASGTWVDGEPTYWSVTVWGDSAQFVADSFSKGDRVIVFGETHTERWENEAGEKRSRLQVRAIDLGPSVRFTQAKPVRRTSRSDPRDAAPQHALPEPALSGAPF